MKLIICIHILLCVLIYACTSSNSDSTTEFIPGIYVRSAIHEYGSEHDTVAIEIQNADANEYSITRRWKYERVLDGKLIEPEYKRQFTTGVYNNFNKVLREIQTGDHFSFDTKERVLFIGSTKYKKL